MRFTETKLAGSFLIDLEPIEDERGFFTRTFCQHEFEEHGLLPLVAQCNLSYNHLAGTLRGLHYQGPPATEAKLVRCTRGAILDVIVDIRPNSPTYLQHVTVELTADNRRAAYLAPLSAHGYQTLTDGAEVTYQVSEFYTPASERSIRYDDPAIGISWPLEVTIISAKDAAAPLVSDMEGSTT